MTAGPSDALLRTEIFAGLQQRDLEELVPHLRQLSFARGEVVWSEGDSATALYVVASGQLKSYRISRDGAELILEITSSGDVIGQVGLFHPSGVRLVCVGAIVPASCVMVPREPLLEFMTRHPIVMRRMLESLSEVGGRAAHALIDVAFEDIRRRVARTLLVLAKEYGEPTDAGVRIRLTLSQTTLASMVAATRENVNRALALLISRGVVSQRDGFFFVHDRNALESEGWPFV